MMIRTVDDRNSIADYQQVDTLLQDAISSYFLLLEILEGHHRSETSDVSDMPAPTTPKETKNVPLQFCVIFKFSQKCPTSTETKT